MTTATFRRLDRRPTLWRVLPGLTPYAEAVAAMHRAHAEIVAGRGREAVWLLQSPAGYSGGSASKASDVDQRAGVPIEAVPGKSRAGDWTYHGPGVRGVVVMLDLRARRRDTQGFVAEVHRWIIKALAECGVAGRREDPAVDPAGVYVGNDKVAAMGFRATSWVTSYGFALYVDPDLAGFAGIAACGIKGRGVTSLAAIARADVGPAAVAPPEAVAMTVEDRVRKILGEARPVIVRSAMDDVDAALRRGFDAVFGATSLAD